MQTTSRLPSFPNSSYFAMNRWFYKMYQADLLYNPDDSAEDIVSIKTGEPCFSPNECVELNKAVSFMFEQHGEMVYDVCLHYARKALDITPEYDPA
jgi:hypothetical protein